MIEIKNLTKIYKLNKKKMMELKTKETTKKAADNITLTANPGEIYGLLGPNGAGKTTTLRCVATLLTPTEGSVSVCGFDTVKESEKVRECIGFLTNEIKLDPHFSPKYLFHFFGKLHGIDEATIEARRKELFEYFEITAFENKKIEDITNIPQTFFLKKKSEKLQSEWNDLILASHEDCLKDKKTYASNFKDVEIESNKKHANRLLQDVVDYTLYINPPYPTMTEQQIDASFDLPYTRLPHPKYAKRGVIPAYEMIRHSINIHRGCFGGCAFCTISAHQGKFVASRSKESIMKEVKQVVEMEDFKGYISDLGGPSANMYRMKGKDETLCEKCIRPTCIQPNVCKNLDTNHHPLIELYKEVDKLPQVKKATIGSGIRYDLFLTNDDHSGKLGYDEYFEQLMKRHVSGRLKVAPEHSSDEVLRLMRKPSFDLFVKLKKKFDKLNEKYNLKQQLIPYFISSHPACTLVDMAELAVKTKDLGYRLEQVQDFTPTPMTLATEIYYSGYDPYTLKPVFVAKTKQEKLDQQRFFFWYKPENRQYVKNALRKLGKALWIDKLFKY